MNSFSKLVALAFLGAGTALLSPTASQAQIQRQAGPIQAVPYPPAPVCCTPARRLLVTDASWMVQPPSGPAHQAALLNPHIYYHTTLANWQWIGNLASDGKYPGEAGTTFTYTYHFCLCGLPPGIKGPVQATMSLQVYSDNEFKAYLNFLYRNVGGKIAKSLRGFPGYPIVPVWKRACQRCQLTKWV